MDVDLNKLGSAHKVLIALYRDRNEIPADDRAAKGQGWTAAEVTVASWRLDPAAFGLSGFVELYPDSNKVFILLMGAKGLVSKGYLRRIGPKRYDLTTLGARVAQDRNIVPGRNNRKGERVTALNNRLRATEILILNRMLDSNCFRRFRAGMTDLWSWRLDALPFWGLTAGKNPDAESVMAEVRVALRKAGELTEGTDIELPGGRVVGHTEIQQLIQCDIVLCQRFRTEVGRL